MRTVLWTGSSHESDGAGDPPILPGDEVMGAAGLELEEAVVEPHRPEDLAAVEPPPLDAQQGGVAFGRQVLRSRTSRRADRPGVLVHDRVGDQGAVLQGDVGERTDLGDDPGVVVAQLQRIAEVSDELDQALALAHSARPTAGSRRAANWWASAIFRL